MPEDKTNTPRLRPDLRANGLLGAKKTTSDYGNVGAARSRARTEAPNAKIEEMNTHTETEKAFLTMVAMTPFGDQPGEGSVGGEPMRGEFAHVVRWIGSINDAVIKSGDPNKTTATIMEIGEEPLFWSINNIGAKRFSFGGSKFIGGPRGEVALDFKFERQEDAALFKLFWC